MLATDTDILTRLRALKSGNPTPPTPPPGIETPPDQTIATRHNNPLNLKYGSATSHWVDAEQAEPGDEATDGGHFLRFQTPEVGFQAARELLFSPAYSRLSVDQALKKWSNNGYGEEASGLPKGRKMSDLTDQEKQTLVSSMAKREGFDAEVRPDTGEPDTLTRLRALKTGKVGAPQAPTSLLRSRQEIAKGEFERNLPHGQRPYEGIGGALQGTGAFLREFVLGGAERAGIDPTSISSTAKSIASIPAGIPKLAAAGPLPQLEALKSMASAPVEAGKEAAQGIREQDPLKMAHGLGGAYVTGAPAIEAGAAAAKGGIRAAASTQSSELIRRRAIQSVLKPDKASVMGAADPVDAVSKLPPSTSLRGLKSRIGEGIVQRETELQQAIAERRSAAEAAGMDSSRMGIDVEPLLRSRVSGLIRQAIENGDRGVAQQLNHMMDARLKGIRQRLGSTYLTPEQILEEKRMLRDEVDFKPKTTLQQNKNAARLGIYRGLDHALDTLVPAAEAINQDYAGLIVGDKLVDARLHVARNADLTHPTLFRTATAMIPDVAAKTGIARALNEPFTPREGTIPLPATSPAYEFHPERPAPPPSPADIYKGRRRTSGVGYPVQAPPEPPPTPSPGEIYSARPKSQTPGYPIQAPPEPLPTPPSPSEIYSTRSKGRTPGYPVPQTPAPAGTPKGLHEKISARDVLHHSTDLESGINILKEGAIQPGGRVTYGGEYSPRSVKPTVAAEQVGFTKPTTSFSRAQRVVDPITFEVEPTALQNKRPVQGLTGFGKRGESLKAEGKFEFETATDQPTPISKVKNILINTDRAIEMYGEHDAAQMIAQAKELAAQRGIPVVEGAKTELLKRRVLGQQGKRIPPPEKPPNIQF